MLFSPHLNVRFNDFKDLTYGFLLDSNLHFVYFMCFEDAEGMGECYQMKVTGLILVNRCILAVSNLVFPRISSII